MTQKPNSRTHSYFTRDYRGFVMLEGECPKCGLRCCGWALQNPKYQTCPDCGTELDIKDSEGMLFDDYEYSTADDYFLKLIRDVVDRKYKDNEHSLDDA